MSLRERIAARVANATLGAAVAGLAAATPVMAQVVRGAVTERGNKTPVSGVLLSVMDARDSVAVQALTNEFGAFEIRLPGPGTYALDVKRIGVRHIRLAPFTIGEGETRPFDVAVEPLPTVLSSVKVTGRTSCVRNPETNARTAALWEDARAALAAERITRRLTNATDSVERFERKLDVNSWRVLYETRRKVSASMDHPFRSLPAEVLSIGGYVTVNQDGSTDYYAPDADVLLSDTFLADHCFKIADGRYDHPKEIGLAFQPVPERKKPDIKGVLWMSRATRELQMLEFSYTWVPNGIRPVDFGGTVSFFRLPGGRWFVRNWRIRMPEFGHDRTVQRYDGSTVSVGRSATPVLARIAEEGGAVPLKALYGQAGKIRGVVLVDTVSKKPVPGITVALEGTGDSTRTAADGKFDLSLVEPGSYTVVLRHPVLDSLGIKHLARTVEVEPGRPVDLTLRFPTNAELAPYMCRVPVDFVRQSLIRFLVVDTAGAPLANTPAVFSRVPMGDDGRPVADSVSSYDVTLDSAGGFFACGLSADEIVRVESVPEAAVAWGETVRPRSGMIGWHVIRMPRKR